MRRLAALLAVALGSFAAAQGYTSQATTFIGGSGPVPVSASNPLPVAASFTPAGSTTVTPAPDSIFVVSAIGGSGGGGGGGSVTQGTTPWVVAGQGVVDTNNSSTATLGGGAVFTGTATDVLTYPSIGLYVFANVSSASGGVSVQFSSDGTNWDETAQTTFTAGGTALADVIPVRGRYYRIVYTNGGSAQASFRLQSVLKPATSAGDVMEMNETPVLSSHGQVVRSAPMGKTSGNVFVNAEAAAAGDGMANPANVVQGGALLWGYNGTTWDRVRTANTGRLQTDVVSGSVSVSALPGSPAQDRTTAAAPGAYRLSDGAAFYDATKTGQLPSALGAQAAGSSLSVVPATASTWKVSLDPAAANTITDYPPFAGPNATGIQPTYVAQVGGWNAFTAALVAATVKPAGATPISGDTSLVVAGHPSSTFNVSVTQPIVAGTNIIGKVTTDQTTHGTTDKVAADLYVAGGAAPGGSGTATANTQRVILATDNPTTAVKLSKVAAANVATAVTVTTSATLLPASALTGRISLCVYNNGAATIYLGPSGVTAASGFPLPAGGAFCDDVGAQAYYGIAAAGTVEARVLEN